MDYALAAPISTLNSDLITRKLRVAGRVQAYDSLTGTITVKDGETDDELLVDISLCMSPFKTYPWLQERNTVVMVVGYLEYDGEYDGDFELAMILRAILLKERSELDLKLWTQSITKSNETYGLVSPRTDAS